MTIVNVCFFLSVVGRPARKREGVGNVGFCLSRFTIMKIYSFYTTLECVMNYLQGHNSWKGPAIFVYRVPQIRVKLKQYPVLVILRLVQSHQAYFVCVIYDGNKTKYYGCMKILGEIQQNVFKDSNTRQPNKPFVCVVLCLSILFSMKLVLQKRFVFPLIQLLFLGGGGGRVGFGFKLISGRPSWTHRW